MGKDVTWGTVGHLTAAQELSVVEMTKLVQDAFPSRKFSLSTLLRFLRARGFNVLKAFQLLKEDAEWRTQFEGYVFSADRDFPPALAMHQDGAIRYAGKSKNGRPVIVLQPRHFWPKLVEDSLQLVMFFVFYVDQLCTRAEQAGEETFVTIADLEGFSMGNFSLSYVKIIVSVLQNHYPERLGTVYVVNAPFIFSAAWRMIQPLLDERTRAKIDILGSSAEDMLKVQQDVDAAHIEQGFGGRHGKYPVPDEIFKACMMEPPAAPGAPLAAAADRGGSGASPPAAAGGKAPAGAVRPKSPAFGNGKTRRRIKHLLKRALFIDEKRATSSSLGLDPNKDHFEDGEAGSPTGRAKVGLMQQVSRRLWAREEDEDEDGDDDEVMKTSREEKIALELREAHDRLLVQVQTVASLHETEIRQLQQQLHALALCLFAVVVFWLMSL